MELTRVGATGHMRVGATLTQVGAIVLAMTGAIAPIARVGAQATEAPAFDVASVKPNHSGLPDEHFGLQPGGRFTATNVRTRELIRSAWGVSDVQIVDAPGWTDSDRFDVVAKAPGNPGPAEVFLMLRSFLAERFHLVVHREKREMRRGSARSH